MSNYHKTPPLQTPEERYQNGKQIGRFKIDILPDSDKLKIFTYWYGFKNSDFKKFPNHPVLEVLKKIYANLQTDEIRKKPKFREFFNDKSKLTKIGPKKNYTKGTKFVAWLNLEILLKPYDFEKGDLVFSYNKYGFPENISESFKSYNTYSFLEQLDNLLQKI